MNVPRCCSITSHTNSTAKTLKFSICIKRDKGIAANYKARKHLSVTNMKTKSTCAQSFSGNQQEFRIFLIKLFPLKRKTNLRIYKNLKFQHRSSKMNELKLIQFLQYIIIHRKGNTKFWLGIHSATRESNI